MANYHLSGNRKSGYSIKRENNRRATAHFATKKEAEAKAKKLSAKSGGGEVKIHAPDGKITDSDTVKPGNDPNPPKDGIH